VKRKAKDQLADLISDTIDRLQAGHRPLSPNAISEIVYKKIDPKTDAPFLVRFTSQCNLADRTRAVLRRLFGGDAAEDAGRTTGVLLQDFYPERANSDVYVPRMKLTFEQRMLNVDRLRMEGTAKNAHADALYSETMMLVKQGKLTMPAHYKAHPRAQAGQSGKHAAQ